jgi:hypothetical protein
MDRISEAVDRLWGSLGKSRRLHESPRFVDELAVQCRADLKLQTGKVSKWSFGHQLEHLFLTSHYVLDRLEEAMSGKNESEWMGLWGASLMTVGFIPRGVFPTIPQLVPNSGTLAHVEPLKEALTDRLSRIDWSLDQILNSRGKSRHPRMKYLTASQWLYFWEVHHRHHLSIMKDIVKATK